MVSKYVHWLGIDLRERSPNHAHILLIYITTCRHWMILLMCCITLSFISLCWFPPWLNGNSKIEILFSCKGTLWFKMSVRLSNFTLWLFKRGAKDNKSNYTFHKCLQPITSGYAHRSLKRKLHAKENHINSPDSKIFCHRQNKPTAL